MSRSASSISSLISPHGIVMASAGTGKTYRLTGEYLRHALRECDRRTAGESADLASILATTFTRKAAGEILDRVLDRLSEAALDPQKLAELRKQVDPSLTAARCHELLAALLSNLERLSVETIDAFFMRIAKLFALELGIPPGWRIAEEQEDEDFREQALDAMLEQGDRAELLAQLQMLTGGKLGRSVRRTVLDAVNAVYEKFLLGDGRREIWSVIGHHAPPLEKPTIDAAIAALATIPLPLTKSGQPNKKWETPHSVSLEAARQRDWEHFLSKGIVAKLIDPDSADPKFHGVPIENVVRNAYQPLIAHAGNVLLSAFRDRNLAIHHFASRFDAAYWKLKTARGLYRFEDIPRILIRASLQENMNEVYFRLDSALRYVLLDEFQDTSLLQFRLLLPLLDEILSADDGRSVFCVGDVKQSLYSWRGAEPDLMPAMPARWPSLVQETLETSYRSSRVITDTVNAVFGNLKANTALNDRAAVAEEWSAAFNTHTTAKKFSGAAQLLVAPVDADGEPQPLAFAAQRVKSILEASPSATVGVLVRRNSRIPRLIYELKRLDIEASEEGGSPLIDSTPVAVADSLLQLADFPGDSAAAFHVAASPLGKIFNLKLPPSSARASEVSALIRARLMSEGFVNVLSWVLSVTAQHMDARGLARFNQLIDLARQFEDRANTRPSKFVQLLRTTSVEDPSRNRVRVMSIHKSKGLEFDAVILPDLDKKWSLNPADCLIDRDGPFEPVTVAVKYPSSNLRAMHPQLNAIYERNLDKLIREELSCLYVAMTRAIHCVEMIIPPSEKPSSSLTAASLLRAALAPNAPAHAGETLWQSTSFQNWFTDVERTPPAASTAPPQQVQFLLAPGSGSFVSRRLRVTPSSLESRALHLDSIFSSRSDLARNQGTLLHAWFELIHWLDDSSPSDSDLLALASNLGWQPRAAADLLPQFRKSLTGDLAHLFRESHYNNFPKADHLEVRREWAFETHLPPQPDRQQSDLAGRFDRLVLGRAADRVLWVHIIDFKSDNIPPNNPAALQQSLANYQPQMRAYALAAQHMFSPEPQNVSASLLYLRPGIIHNLPPLA